VPIEGARISVKLFTQYFEENRASGRPIFGNGTMLQRALSPSRIAMDNIPDNIDEISRQ
jgi:hypothetical protein